MSHQFQKIKFQTPKKMQKIDLKKIIKNHNLEFSEVAKHLFPKNKYPNLALNRVMQGVTFLNSEQLSRLSLLANVQIGELFGLNWKSKKIGDLMTLSTGNYKAELDTRSWVTKVFDRGSLFHESIIHSGSIPLSRYLTSLNSIIVEHKTKK